ncbi:MAG: MFS transporter [Cupriavidus sp.]|jgi:sugar phosphate permease|uniref:MFS transporter n=1 Tax=Cupriavidus pauculus TaxID=82633 RepID=UPI000C525331|nr:MFS transporter [Cupriavidus pauculus]MBU69230.1 MFS transporter [Cupriavidus sp.]MCM3609421.1 MFS transporter [Cupriavidus pauculus]
MYTGRASSPSAPKISTIPRRNASHHRWIVLAVGGAAQASFSVAFTGLPVAGVLMRSAYQMSTEQLGFVLGCMALGVTFSEIVWGLITDVFGDRRVLLTGLLSTCVVLLAMAMFMVPSDGAAPGYLLLGACLVLVGVLSGSVNSSSGRAIMGWFTDEKRGLAMSIRQTAIPAGGAIGAALTPWLAHSFGFKAVFAVFAAIYALSALLTWLWLHEHEAPAATASSTSVPAQDRSPLKRLDIWRLAIASGLLTVPQIAVLTFGGIFLHDTKAADLVTISAAIIVVQIVGSIARIALGMRADRGSDRRKLVRDTGVLTALAAGALATLTNAPMLWVLPLVCLCGVLASAWHGVAYTEIAVMAGAKRSGTALGIIGMTIFASASITPALISLTIAKASWQATWAMVALAALVAVSLAPTKLAGRGSLKK